MPTFDFLFLPAKFGPDAQRYATQDEGLVMSNELCGVVAKFVARVDAHENCGPLCNICVLSPFCRMPFVPGFARVCFLLFL